MGFYARGGSRGRTHESAGFRCSAGKKHVGRPTERKRPRADPLRDKSLGIAIKGSQGVDASGKGGVSEIQRKERRPSSTLNEEDQGSATSRTRFKESERGENWGSADGRTKNRSKIAPAVKRRNWYRRGVARIYATGKKKKIRLSAGANCSAVRRKPGNNRLDGRRDTKTRSTPYRKKILLTRSKTASAMGDGTGEDLGRAEPAPGELLLGRMWR